MRTVIDGIEVITGEQEESQLAGLLTGLYRASIAPKAATELSGTHARPIAGSVAAFGVTPVLTAREAIR